MRELIDRKTEAHKMKLDLNHKIWSKVSSVKFEYPLIDSITLMTQCTLDAAASSLLIAEEENQEILLKFAYGPIGKQIRRLPSNQQSGIASWVSRNGKPLIVNDVSKDGRFSKLIDEVGGLVTKSVICAPLISHRKVIGVIEVFNKLNGPAFSEHDLQTLTAVAATATMAIENARLNQSMQDSYKSTISALVSAADARETTARGHSRRVSRYALMGATELGLSPKEKQVIESAGILHDIGKLGIPDSILNKSEALTNREWAIIHKHPVTGFDLVRGVPSLQEESKIILFHHERYDGKGYPQGLRGESIPMAARLIAVADAFDHMTTEHAYRVAFGKKEALIELRRYADSQFCPNAVKAFCSGFVKSHLASKIQT